MKSKFIADEGGRTLAVVFDKGEEVAAGLVEIAREHNLTAASFTAIGALSNVTLGYFDRERMECKKIPIKEQVEALSLTGDIALSDGRPKAHAHVVVGKSDGTAHGGHLLEAHVWPTLEMVITESPRYLERKIDQASGMALIDPGA